MDHRSGDLAAVPPLDVTKQSRQRRRGHAFDASGLPERCRQVMMLRHLDGLPYKEIAERMGISPETVKVHMIKGVKDCTRFFHQRGLLGPDAPANRLAS